MKLIYIFPCVGVVSLVVFCGGLLDVIYTYNDPMDPKNKK